MTEKEAINTLENSITVIRGGKTLFESAIQKAIKALQSRIRIREYIKQLDQPEYKNIVWKKEEVVLLLKELLAE